MATFLLGGCNEGVLLTVVDRKIGQERLCCGKPNLEASTGMVDVTYNRDLHHALLSREPMVSHAIFVSMSTTEPIVYLYGIGIMP